MEYTGVAELAAQPIQAMSGGQRQRVLLAKVLAQQTPLLFLDEPATGLDMVYQEEIFRFCRELCAAGKTVLMVAHELSLAARFCSRLLLAAKGGILADGTAVQVLLPAILAKVYDMPIEVSKNPLTDHIELFTRPANADSHRRALLERILGYTAAKECEPAV
jgi:iron complex transport system ATP-binding protein